MSSQIGSTRLKIDAFRLPRMPPSGVQSLERGTACPPFRRAVDRRRVVRANDAEPRASSVRSHTRATRESMMFAEFSSVSSSQLRWRSRLRPPTLQRLIRRRRTLRGRSCTSGTRQGSRSERSCRSQPSPPASSISSRRPTRHRSRLLLTIGSSCALMRAAEPGARGCGHEGAECLRGSERPKWTDGSGGSTWLRPVSARGRWSLAKRPRPNRRRSWPFEVAWLTTRQSLLGECSCAYTRTRG